MGAKCKRERPDFDALADKLAKLKPGEIKARLAAEKLNPAWLAEVLLRLRSRGVLSPAQDIKRFVRLTPEELDILSGIQKRRQFPNRSQAIRFCIVSQGAAIRPEKFPGIEVAMPVNWAAGAERCANRVRATAHLADHNQSVVMDRNCTEGIAAIEHGWESQGWDVSRQLNKIVRWSIHMQRSEAA